MPAAGDSPTGVLGLVVIEYASEFLGATWVTVRLFAAAAVLGVALALVAGMARLASRRSIRIVSRAYVEFFRGTSLLVQLFWIFFALPALGIRLEPFTAGALALGLNAGAYGSEIVRAAVLAVPAGQVQASIALHLSPSQRFLRVVLPQALPISLPPFNNLLIEILKGTSLVSLIGLTDLTLQAQTTRSAIGQSTEIFVSLLIIYFVLAQVVGVTVRRVERWSNQRAGADGDGAARTHAQAKVMVP